MNDILSLIGTIASVGSVPLSVYLFLKSKENKIDKTKREIVRILSHQIGDRRKLTAFEIQSVINSKAQENKISQNKIMVNEIVEDLVSDTISNPLLNNNLKEEILIELKAVFYRNEHIREKEVAQEIAEGDEITQEDLEKIRDRINEKQKAILENIREQTFRTSEFFGITTAVGTVLLTMVTFAGKENYEKFSTPLYEFFAKNDFYIALISGIIISAVSAILLFFTMKWKK